MKYVLIVLISVGVLAYIGYSVYGLVRDIKSKKKEHKN